ncbi:hypothetical protein NST55_29330 [Bacillus sp. FSL R10-2789]|uniref:hypothetical protein n=1 Tax=Bacillus sp. FSL R10-2789 TaxID=2954662 RepID=UPI0030F8EFDD
MNNKLLLALTSCVLIMGLAACSSNETARNSNDSKAEEKVQKETEKAQKAEEKAKQEEQQRQKAEAQKQTEEKAKQEAEAQRQAEEKAKQEQAERVEQQRQEQEQARKQQEAQKQREVKQQKKEEPELCGSPEVGITCEHVQKEWENEQKIEAEQKALDDEYNKSHQLSQEVANKIVIGSNFMKYDSILPLPSDAQVRAGGTQIYIYKQGNKQLRMIVNKHDHVTEVNYTE